MRCRKVLPPRRSFDLSRPIRALDPPARIKTASLGLRAAIFCRCTPAMNRVGPVRVHKKEEPSQQHRDNRDVSKSLRNSNLSETIPLRSGSWSNGVHDRCQFVTDQVGGSVHTPALQTFATKNKRTSLHRNTVSARAHLDFDREIRSLDTLCTEDRFATPMDGGSFVGQSLFKGT